MFKASISTATVLSLVSSQAIMIPAQFQLSGREAHRCYAPDTDCIHVTEYWNPLACKCFKKYHCEKLCPKGQEMLPTEVCKCVDTSEVEALYPAWATPADKKNAELTGLVAARDRPKDWKVCPRKGDECQDGQYWNQLSCRCFSVIFCMMMCGVGQELDPTKGCTCMDSEKVRELYYPSWATEYDISLSQKEGFNYWEQSNRVRVCPHNKNKDKCGEGEYWNELACQCFHLAKCKKMCPPGQRLLPTESCTCDDQAVVDALYPEWATQSDKQLATNLGYLQREKDNKARWPTCPTPKKQCDWDFYFNELACECFSLAQCFAPCPAGQFDLPTEHCGCTTDEKEYLALFPEWATDEDIARSITEGMMGKTHGN